MGEKVGGTGRRLLGSCLAVFMFLLLIGCGAGKGTVSGKVLYKGQPLKGGNVTFSPEQEGATTLSSRIQEDGSYTVQGIATGPVKIAVETESAKPPPTPQQLARRNVAPVPGDPNAESKEGGASRYVKIPAKYKDSATSDLKYTVQRGSQSFDIKLD
jgi:hypothetical protein